MQCVEEQGEGEEEREREYGTTESMYRKEEERAVTAEKIVRRKSDDF